MIAEELQELDISTEGLTEESSTNIRSSYMLNIQCCLHNLWKEGGRVFLRFWSTENATNDVQNTRKYGKELMQLILETFLARRIGLFETVADIDGNKRRSE